MKLYEVVNNDAAQIDEGVFDVISKASKAVSNVKKRLSVSSLVLEYARWSGRDNRKNTLPKLIDFLSFKGFSEEIIYETINRWRLLLKMKKASLQVYLRNKDKELTEKQIQLFFKEVKEVSAEIDNSIQRKVKNEKSTSAKDFLNQFKASEYSAQPTIMNVADFLSDMYFSQAEVSEIFQKSFKILGIANTTEFQNAIKSNMKLKDPSLLKMFSIAKQIENR